MINKIYKTINNNYSVLFKFIFFLRYLLGIFFISSVLYLSIPHFINLKNKEEVIKNYLLESYNLQLNSYESIKYNSFPIPNLEIQNVEVSINSDLLRMNISSLNIYPKLFNIYNYENYETTKIVLNKNNILLKDTDLKNFINYIYNLKNRLTFKNLNLKIYKQETSIINLKKINFSNYGYYKNIVRGELFNKKFKILISDDYNKINFKLFKNDIAGDINFNETKKNSVISGIFKIQLLNSKLKFDFDYDGNKLKIYNSYFRSRDLSFKNNNTIIMKPYFYVDSIFNIEKINPKLIKRINLNKILLSKDLIKTINTKSEINLRAGKFSRNLIKDLNLNISLAYGRLTYQKKISISGSFLTCKGDINLLEEYPILNFDCSIASNNKKELLKQFSIHYKNKNEIFNLNANGNVNILNKKINIKNITLNQDYKASKEDLNYFKQSFESILFNKDFASIFNLKKIKKFIMEIS